MDEEDRLELEADYLLSLFELGKYNKLLKRIDPLIEEVIEKNIFRINDLDIFEELLLKKAAALYNTHNISESNRICFEILKLNPGHKVAKSIAYRCALKQKTKLYHLMSAVSIGLFLFSAVIISLELLFVKPFYPDLGNNFEVFRNIVLALASLLLIGGQVSFRAIKYLKLHRSTQGLQKKNSSN